MITVAKVMYFIFAFSVFSATDKKRSTEISAFQTVVGQSQKIKNITTSKFPCVALSANHSIKMDSKKFGIPKDTLVCRNKLRHNVGCFLCSKKILNEVNNNFEKPDLSYNYWVVLGRKTKYGLYETEEWSSLDDIESGNLTIADEDITEKNYSDFEIIGDLEYFNKVCTHDCRICNDYEYYLCPADIISNGTSSRYCYAEINSLLCYSTNDKETQNVPFIGLEEVSRLPIVTSGRLKKIETTTDSAEMVLNFNKKSRKLHLIIYCPEELFQKGQEKFINCFTNASKKLKKAVKVEKIFEYVNKRNEEEKTFFVYKIKLEKYMGQYWCEAYKNEFKDDLVRSNKIIAYKRKEGNEYSLRMVIQEVCEIFYCGNDTVAVPFEEFVNNNVTAMFKQLKAEIRVMEIFYYDYMVLDFLLHISTRKKSNITAEFIEFNSGLGSSSNNIKIKYFKNCEYCLPETTSQRNVLSWPATQIGSHTLPEEMCLQKNNLPVVRECGGDFLYGADWLQASGDCESGSNPPESTEYLYWLKNNISSTILQNITSILNSEQNLSVLNIYYVTKILEEVSKDFGDNNQVINDTLKVVDCLLDGKSDNFREAQYLLNANNVILDVIEDILTNFKYDSNVYLFQQKYIIVHVTKPFSSNVSGLLVYSSEAGHITVDNFMRNDTFDHIVHKHSLILAVIVPEEILAYIPRQNSTDIRIIITVLFDDRFFSSNKDKPTGPVVSVTIPDYGSFLPSSLPILFKAEHTESSTLECSYWDYGKSNSLRKNGLWIPTGGNYLGSVTESIHICTFSHLTHFALLILEETSAATDSNAAGDHLLNIISFIGSTLTIIGICGIFLTALLFEKWRKRQGTKILINLSTAIFLEAVMLHLSEFRGFIRSELDCRIVGSLTHYVVLSKFFWMLVYAFLQYMRFVKVLGAFPQRVMLKSAIFGWGFAVIPVVAVNLATPYSYSKNDYHFCYPKDVSLYLGVLLPVITIIMVNFIVFCVVMYKVSTSKIKSRSSNGSYTLQLKLATLLFFVLGIPWIFGVLANLITNSFLKLILVYSFCTTSTVQGFILFLFYVVLNKETRMYWSKYMLNVLKVSVVTNSTS